MSLCLNAPYLRVHSCAYILQHKDHVIGASEVTQHPRITHAAREYIKRLMVKSKRLTASPTTLPDRIQAAAAPSVMAGVAGCSGVTAPTEGIITPEVMETAVVTAPSARMVNPLANTPLAQE